MEPRSSEPRPLGVRRSLCLDGIDQEANCYEACFFRRCRINRLQLGMMSTEKPGRGCKGTPLLLCKRICPAGLDAMAEAQRGMIKDGDYAHPAAWAGFQVMGMP